MSSDADGKYRVDGLPPGKYTVSAVAPQRYADFGGRKVEVQDRGCAEVNFSTRIDGHISGHVYYSDGTPAAGVYLTAKRADDDPHNSSIWGPSYTHSGADGSFDLSPLSPGSYIFGANMDFSLVASDKPTYYRKAFYPGSASRSDATVFTLDAGQVTENLRFFLPPDSAPPSVPLAVTVLGFDGQPAANAQILAYDDQWENSSTAVHADADEHGKATALLRPGLHYDIEAVVNLPDSSPACAGPVGIDIHDRPAPLQLVLSHHTGNCMQFKKSAQGAAAPR